MNNDFISREELRKAIEDRKDYIPASEYDKGWNNAIYAVIDEIDNAPTVEPTFGMFREMLCAECEKNCAECKEKRPQGKWEEPFENNGKTYHKCNRCHISSELILIDNFCPNCGADMRGDVHD